MEREAVAQTVGGPDDKEIRTMKLLRYGPPGQERPGLLDANNQIRDLAGHLADVDGQALAPEQLARLSKLDPATLPVVDGSPRLGCPVGSVSKFIAVGLNYADHAAESNMALPKHGCSTLIERLCMRG